MDWHVYICIIYTIYIPYTIYIYTSIIQASCAPHLSSFLLPYLPDTIWNNFIAAPIHTKRLIIFSWRVCVVAISSRVCSKFQIESKQKKDVNWTFLCMQNIDANLDQLFIQQNRFFGSRLWKTAPQVALSRGPCQLKLHWTARLKVVFVARGYICRKSHVFTFSNPITPFLQRPGKFSTLTTTFSSFAFTWQNFKSNKGWRIRHKSQMIAFHDMIKLKNGCHARIYEPFLLIAPQPGPSRTLYTFQQVIFSNCSVHSLH